jgi:hypothetical protein
VRNFAPPQALAAMLFCLATGPWQDNHGPKV